METPAHDHANLGAANFCTACAVRNRAICADLDGAEIAALNTIGRRRQLAVGEPLLWEGDEAIVVANVIEGVMKLSTRTAEGGEQIVGLAYPSDFLGRPFGTVAPYGAEALTPVELCVFPRAAFDHFARSHPRLEHRLLQRTLGELDRARESMLLLGRQGAQSKLARFLLDMAERGAPGCGPAPLDGRGPGHGDEGGEVPIAITLPLSRRQIADVLGLTIETVSRQFSRLRQAGLIDLPARRDVVILDRARLHDRAR